MISVRQADESGLGMATAILVWAPICIVAWVVALAVAGAL